MIDDPHDLGFIRLNIFGHLENRHRRSDLDRFPNRAGDLKHDVGLGGIVAGHSRRLRDLAAGICGVELERNDAGLARLDLTVPGPRGRAPATGTNVADLEQGRARVGEHEVVPDCLARADLAKIENWSGKFDFGTCGFRRARGGFGSRWRGGILSPCQA
jgi:hypothetical protein